MNQQETLRLALRWKQLEESGALPSPTDERVTVVLRATRHHWTKHALYWLDRHSRQSLQVIVVPEEQLYRALLDQWLHESEASLSHLFVPSYDRLSIQALSPISGVNLLNAALTRAEDPFVVLLDDAATVGPDWLPRLLWPFYDDSTIQVTGPLTNRGCSPHSLLNAASNMAELIAFQRDLAARGNARWEFASTLGWPCLVLRRDALREIGLLNDAIEDYPTKIEDWLRRARTSQKGLALCRDVYVHALVRENHKFVSNEVESWRRGRNDA